MSVYSIKDLEHLSGIKAHTIRIWEQRYTLFSPQRTSSNIRFYSEEDLKLMLNVSTLKNHGHKISKIVRMTNEQIHAEVNRISETHKTLDDQMHTLTVSMVDMNESMFLEVLKNNTERYGFKRTVMEVVYPFMNKIGILWLTNSINPAQEHFITNLVRQKLIAATDALSIQQEGHLVLLYLPEGELHELGLLFANYILRSMGIRTIFFGQSVPLNALEEVYHQINPSYIITAMTTAPDLSEVQKYVFSISKKFKNSKIFITGPRVVGNDIQTPSNVEIIRNFRELDKIQEEIEEELAIDKKKL